ncbi:hypothetical protein HN011_011918 [Eciton burchellii]|nr:hypothetical protein HN011_011918 [Eciton burchellii]
MKKELRQEEQEQQEQKQEQEQEEEGWEEGGHDNALGVVFYGTAADMVERLDDSGGKAHYAIVAGIFATSGSLLGKLAGGVDASSLPMLLLKSMLLIFMIVCNTVGCMFFVKALHGSGSSLPVTIASAATNYICSALVGFILFDESTSLAWWCGTSLVLFGLILISHVPKEDTSIEKRLKQQ